MKKLKVLLCIAVVLVGFFRTSLYGARAEEIKQEEKHIPLAGVCKHLMVTFESPLEKEKVGYTTTKVNLRQEPTTNSEIIKTLSINTKIKYYDYDDKWIELVDGKGYISKDYISDTKTKIKTFTLPKNHLTKYNGVCYYNGRRESYYNLPMSQVIKYMHDLGFEGEYSIRADGVKLFNGYVIVAADLSVYPKGTILECSLGKAIVCDTGSFTRVYGSSALDVAVAW